MWHFSLLSSELMFGYEQVGPGVGQFKETASTELEQWITAAFVNSI